MELKNLTSEEYADAFSAFEPHVYNSVIFNNHNSNKADQLQFMGFSDKGRLCAGIILGRRESMLMSPFSAPFGGFTASPEIATEKIWEATGLLQQYAAERELTVRLTLPPAFYSPRLFTLQTAALSHHGSLMYTDVNHHLELPASGVNGASLFKQKARNSYNSASRRGFSFERLDATCRSDTDRLYEVIASNHADLDHPLRMSAKQVFDTAPLTGSAFYIVSLAGDDVAAAMINSAADGVAQVIYWGDRMQYRHLHPMNLLAARVVEECSGRGFAILDIGPSSEHGIPSPGLCRFKESLGCKTGVKPTFQL